MNKEEITTIIREKIQARFPGVQGLSLEILLAIVQEELLEAGYPT